MKYLTNKLAQFKKWILSIVIHSTCEHMYIEHMRGNVFKCQDCNRIFVMKEEKMMSMLKSFIK